MFAQNCIQYGYDGIMLPEKFLESDVQYEKPYSRVIDFQTSLDSEEQTEEKLLQELRENALAYLEENKVPKVSYTIISNINEKLEIGDTIKVLHPFVNIFTEVLEYEYNLNSKKVVSLTFGNYNRDVKTKFDNIKNTITELNQTLSKQDTVIKKQTDLINSLNKNGYVYIDDNEILILDTIPKEQAKNVWRFGLGGIGFSSNGYEGPFELAMTMDGQINANFITTGTLSTSRIEGLSNFISATVTGTYATKKELENTQKTLQASIELKLNVNDLISEINASADRISLKVGRLVITTGKFQLDESGNITATSGTIGGFTLRSAQFSGDLSGLYDYNYYDVRNAASIAVGFLNSTTMLSDLYDIDKDSKVNSSDGLHMNRIIAGTETNTKQITGTFQINTKDPKNCITIKKDGMIAVSIGLGGINSHIVSAEDIVCSTGTSTTFSGVAINGKTGAVMAQSFDNSSLVELKKNISEIEDVMDIIKKSTIYKFNYKTEDDNTKKHAGFIIGDSYNTPDQVISVNKRGIDLYSMASLEWKAIQEIIYRIEKLEGVK